MKHTKFPKKPILIVDDEKLALESLEVTLFTSGLDHVLLCHDSRNVMPLLEQENVSLVLLDIVMPHQRGDQILKEIKTRYPHIPVIMTTAVQDLEVAIACLREGAYDYILKPIASEKLINSIHRVLEFEALSEENITLKNLLLEEPEDGPHSAFQKIITQNSKMHSLFRYCEAVAPSSHPILINGETGTGKELIAEAIHRASDRKGKFVAVNVAGLDDQLFADTLFGHTRGAFTSANDNRKGLIDAAQNGTLFLDEIGDLSMNSQLKLLRLLQEHEYSALGSDIVKTSNARILVATNVNLEEAQKNGKFRQDLFYRLISHRLRVPALRDRKDDIAVLLDHFIGREAKALKRTVPTYGTGLLHSLMNHSFPGNIRELEAMVIDVITTNPTPELPSDAFHSHVERLPDQPEALSASLDPSSMDALDPSRMLEVLSYKEATKEFQRRWILEALKRTENNQSNAARLLGISQQALSKRLKEF